MHVNMYYDLYRFYSYIHAGLYQYIDIQAWFLYSVDFEKKMYIKMKIILVSIHRLISNKVHIMLFVNDLYIYRFLFHCIALHLIFYWCNKTSYY